MPHWVSEPEARAFLWDIINALSSGTMLLFQERWKVELQATTLLYSSRSLVFNIKKNYLSPGVHCLYPQGQWQVMKWTDRKTNVASEDSQSPWVRDCFYPFCGRYKITRTRILALWRRLLQEQWKKGETEGGTLKGGEWLTGKLLCKYV